MATAPFESWAAYEAAVSSHVKKELNNSNVPGMCVCVVRDGKIIFIQGFGTKDKTSGVPVSIDTVFCLGSLSKVFTGVAVMQLVEKGAISLDAEVRSILPEFTLSTAVPITIKHLLSHHAGLPHTIEAGDKSQPKNLSQMVHFCSCMKLEHPVGSCYSYSNAGFTVLGRVIEVVSGRAFARYVQEEIFNPLQMQTASFEYWHTLPPHIMQRWARGHTNNAEPVRQLQQIWGLPAGAMVASAHDLAEFVKTLLNNGVHPETGRMLLRPETLQQMFAPHNDECRRPNAPPKADDPPMGWAFMLSKRGYPTDQVVWHNGKTNGFQSDMLLLVNRNVGVCSLMNVSSDSFQLGPLTRSVMELTLRLPGGSSYVPSASLARNTAPAEPASTSATSPAAAVKEGSLVCLLTAATGKTMRVKPDGSGNVSADGLYGPLATWVVHSASNGIKLQNKQQPERWLRVTRDGQVEAKGEGGPLCIFELVDVGSGAIALKSVATQLMVGFASDGQPLHALERGSISAASRFSVKPPKTE